MGAGNATKLPGRGKKSTSPLSLSGHGKFSGTCRTHRWAYEEPADLTFYATINRDDLVRGHVRRLLGYFEVRHRASSVEKPSDHSVSLMVSIMAPLFHGLHGFRPGPIDPWSRPRPPRQEPRFVNQIGFPRADPEGNRLFRRRTKLIEITRLLGRKARAGIEGRQEL